MGGYFWPYDRICGETSANVIISCAGVDATFAAGAWPKGVSSRRLGEG